MDSRVARVLDLVELKGFGKKFPWQLSGGMQQRASIARALAFDADILLMDEPFGALDEIVRDHLNEELLKLWARTGKPLVCYTFHPGGGVSFHQDRGHVPPSGADLGRHRLTFAEGASAGYPRQPRIHRDRASGAGGASGRSS